MNATYVVRVQGHLDDHWGAWLGELQLTHHQDGTTTLTVETGDQARLHGLLAALRDLGAVLLELRTTETPATNQEGQNSAQESGGESGIRTR
jgi:hypothetical protein